MEEILHEPVKMCASPWQYRGPSKVLASVFMRLHGFFWDFNRVKGLQRKGTLSYNKDYRI